MVVVSTSRSFRFHCDICHNENWVKVSPQKIHTCLHCGALLCKNCDTYGFCLTGFQNLSRSMQQKIIQIDEIYQTEYRARRSKYNRKVLVGIMFCMIGIIVLIEKFLILNNPYWNWMDLFIFIPLIFGFIILFNSEKESPDKNEIYFQGKVQKLKILSEEGDPVKKGYVLPEDEFVKFELKLIE